MNKSIITANNLNVAFLEKSLYDRVAIEQNRDANNIARLQVIWDSVIKIHDRIYVVGSSNEQGIMRVGYKKILHTSGDILVSWYENTILVKSGTVSYLINPKTLTAKTYKGLRLLPMARFGNITVMQSKRPVNYSGTIEHMVAIDHTKCKVIKDCLVTTSGLQTLPNGMKYWHFLERLQYGNGGSYGIMPDGKIMTFEEIVNNV